MIILFFVYLYISTQKQSDTNSIDILKDKEKLIFTYVSSIETI